MIRWTRFDIAATTIRGELVVGSIEKLCATHVELLDLVTHETITVPIASIRRPTEDEVMTRAHARSDVEKLRAEHYGHAVTF